LKKLKLPFTAIVVAALIAAFVAGAEPLRWRSEVLLRFAKGQLADVTLVELLYMLRANSGFRMRAVAHGSTLRSVIENPMNSPVDVRAGATLFRQTCRRCHGSGAEGAAGPALTNRALLQHGASDWAIFRNIRHGIPNTGMAPTGLSFDEAWQVVAFLTSLQTAHAALGQQSDENRKLTTDFRNVTASYLLEAGQDERSWPMYSRTYSGWRFSPLSQINASNVAHLKLRWIHQLSSSGEKVEAAPIVVNGMMFLTEPPNNVLALNARNGDLIWSYRRELPDSLSLCCGQINRGVAVLNDKVYVGTLDAHLVALNARTGAVIWDKEIASPKDGYSITGAPLALRDMVITGVSGGEFGVRGFIQAVDARTGALRWRFYTIPEPAGAPANDTASGSPAPGSTAWVGDSWKTGGGPTWITGSYDPSLNLLYWGVGNPNPDFNGDSRPGDNLYTDSVVALDATTGQLRWHFQFTPHDEHDWDSNQVPILTSIKHDGTDTLVIAWANRNGFYYVLNRRNGRFITGVPFTKQTWAKGLDPSGRPVLDESATIGPGGTFTYPGTAGGVNWQSPAFNPELGLFYVHANETPAVFTKSNDEKISRTPYQMTLGSNTDTVSAHHTFVRALRVDTGERVWQYESQKSEHTGRSGWSGLLATGGNLVFGAAGNQLFALNGETGQKLWSVLPGGRSYQGPISFSDSGEQYIVFIAGDAVIAFSL
jgi:alcohol dehydrogenase (cytochrome c)